MTALFVCRRCIGCWQEYRESAIAPVWYQFWYGVLFHGVRDGVPGVKMTG